MSEQFDEIFDVLVIGSGCGGLTAALTADISNPAKVLVIEKSHLIGGTSATSGGVIWIPDNHLGKEKGAQDSISEAKDYLKATIPTDEFNEPLIDAYLDQGPKMVKFMQDHTDARYTSLEHYPDYFQDAPGVKLGNRALEPLPVSADVLGDDVDNLHPSGPQTIVFGRYGVNFEESHAFTTQSPGWFRLFAKIFLTYWLDFSWRIKRKRSRRLAFGAASVTRLFASVKKRNIPIWRSAELKEFILGDNRVIGAVIHKDGRLIKVQARRGVIVASGGFGQNQEMREKYLPKPTNSDWGCEPKTNTGDPIKAAEAIGAQLKFMDKAWWVTTVKAPNEEFPRLSEVEKSLPGNYTVNKSGKRFANESQNYLTFMLEVLDKEKKGESCAPMYMIFDANHRKNYPVGPLMPGKFFPDKLIKIIHKDWFESDFLTTANTIEELAIKIGIDSEALQSTVKRVNNFSVTGKDLDFQRGDNERDRFSGDPSLLNPCLGPIDKPPFYAMRIDPGEFATCGGMVINEYGQVLDNDNQAIAGLYATGNCTPALLTTYPGPGATIGPAMTFGFIAGKHISGSNAL
ncbi:FAD-dependent oxidoreductase [Gammaproteobacteria bacterium]|nr:FAD-dependent oxidoreductase [Gammaproteobacteria bacterium]